MGKINVVALISYLLLGSAIMMSIYTMVKPFWVRDDPNEKVRRTDIVARGLWIKCTFKINEGQRSCDRYRQFIFDLPGELLIARGLMILTVIFGSFSFTIGMIAQDCVLILQKVYHLRDIFTKISAVLSGLAGSCIFIACTTYGKLVMKNRGGGASSSQQKEVFGSCLYIGWIASIMYFSAMICLFFVTSKTHRDQRKLEKGNMANEVNQGAGYQGAASTANQDFQYGYNKQPVEYI